jgi:predicted outer membrane repeat protein
VAVWFANHDNVADTIELPTGNYQLSLGALEVYTYNKLTIEPQMGGNVTVDGMHKSSVFQVDPGSNVDLDYLTIQNAHGSGIVNSGTVTINNCTLSQNQAVTDGAGLLNLNGGNATVKYSTFQANTGANKGGGVCNLATLSIAGCLFQLNQANLGGGVYNDANGSAEIEGGAFDTNTAHWGGGVYTSGNMTVSVGATFSNNQAPMGAGGGIANDGGTLAITDSALTSNNSADEGGGLFNTGTATLANDTITQNHAIAGGGIFNHGIGTVTIKGPTPLHPSGTTIISNNVASGQGGGIYSDSMSAVPLSILQTKISGNQAPTGFGIYSRGNKPLIDSWTLTNSADNTFNGFVIQ